MNKLTPAISILLVCAPIIAVHGDERGPPKELAVEWRGSCALGSPAPYFILHIKTDGKVVFDGLRAVNEIGERQTKITAESAQSLIRGAEKILASDKVKRLQNETYGPLQSPSHTACFYLMTKGAGEPSVGLVVMESEEGIRLEKTLGRLLKLNKWICPARDEVPYEAKYCEQPALSYIYSDSEACEGRHVTNLYASGMVHYYVRGLDGEDVYRKIDPSKIKRLRTVVDELISEGLPFDEILFPVEGRKNLERPRAKTRRLTAYGVFATRFRDRVREEAALEWVTPLPSSVCLNEKLSGPLGQVAL
jgi:hypothetical protein